MKPLWVVLVPGSKLEYHCFLYDPIAATKIRVYVLPLTLILCWKYHKSRNPVPIMVGHAVIDVATVVQILATSAIPGFYEMMCGM